MSDYTELKGLKVKYLDSDPSPGTEGDVWYNTASGALKAFVATSAWSSSSSLTTSRYGGIGAGTQTAALAAGGNDPPSTVATEEYNGSGWATGGNMNTARYLMGGSGTQTAALASGGDPIPGSVALTEEYDGTSWTESGDLNTARKQCSGQFGIQTAAVLAGGYAGGDSNAVEEYNGTSWTAGEALPAAQNNAAGFGILTAGIYATGVQPPNTAVLEYDGTDWTAVNSANTGGSGRAGAGVQTAGIIMGASTPSINGRTETWDGTSWTEVADLGTSRYNGMGANTGTSSTSLLGGGATSSETGGAQTEEFNTSISTITAGAWSSGANYPATIQDATGAGPGTAAVVYGGWMTAVTDTTSEYDGSSWTAGGNLGTARAAYQSGTGSQTAALCASGYGTTNVALSEEYNGSSWTEGNSMNQARYTVTGGGVQTSAIFAGGSQVGVGPPSSVTNAESYNGTSWTNETVTPANKWTGKAFSGTSETSNIFIGVGSDSDDTFSYDGSSWTDLSRSLVTGKNTIAGGSQQGTSTSAIITGGFSPAPAIVATSQQYNGTAWVTAPSISTARRGGAAAGTYSAALAVGGERPAQSNATEEWTPETSTATAKTIDFD